MTDGEEEGGEERIVVDAENEEARSCDDPNQYAVRCWPESAVQQHEEFSEAMGRHIQSIVSDVDGSGFQDVLNELIMPSIDHFCEVYSRAIVAMVLAKKGLPVVDESSPGHEIELIHDQFIDKLDEVGIGLFTLKAAVEGYVEEKEDWSKA